MKNPVKITEVYVNFKKEMIPMEKGVLSLDSEAVINAFRKAAQAEKKDLQDQILDVISNPCKPS